MKHNISGFENFVNIDEYILEFLENMTYNRTNVCIQGGYMRILHCADIHLDSALSTSLTADQAVRRRNEILMTFVQMIKYAQKQHVNIVIIAGDMFDTDIILPKTKHIVLDCIRKCPDIQFLYLTGNHDTQSLQADAGGNGWPPNFKIMTKTALYYEKAGVCIYSLKDTGELERIRPDRRTINIVVYHGMVNRPSDFAGYNIDYLALGHIHSYSAARIDERGVCCYCGCLEPRGYDECGSKGFVILDINGSSISHRFVPFASRHAVSLKINIEGCYTTPDVIACIESVCSQNNVTSKDMVKAELNGDVTDDYEIDISYILQHFANQFFSFRIEDNTRVRKKETDMDRLGMFEKQFVQLILNSDEETSDKEKIIKYGIKALRGDTII